MPTARLTAGRCWLVAAAAGCFMSLAAPPVDFFPALWLGMAALAYVLEEPTSGRRWRGAGRGLAFGVAVNVVSTRFIPAVIVRFTPLPWVVAALALFLYSLEAGLRWMVAGVIRDQLARRGLPSWAAFAIGVYTGSFVPMVLPWTAASDLTPWPAMVQLADLVGERGVTLLIALSAGLLASAARAMVQGHKPLALRLCAIAISLPLATLLHGAWRMSVVEAARSHAPTARVGLVQPGTDALDRWREDNRGAILGRLTSLTKGAEKSGVDLTVWPEASYPFPVAHWTRHCPTGDRAILPFGVKGPVLTGMVMTSANGALYNSAVICSTEGDLSDPYDKINLLWFGETIPIVGQIPWVRERFLHGRGLVPGRKNVILATGAIRASVLNCFEDVLPSAGREAMEGGPNLLVNITNDAWFFGTYESEFHARFAALRAVEERRDLVRAVNLGPTTWVDAAGRVRARYADAMAGTLLAQPALLDTPVTVFGRFGDWPLIVALGVLAVFVLVRTKRKERRTLEPRG